METSNLSLVKTLTFLIAFCMFSFPLAVISAPEDPPRAAPVSDRIHLELTPIGSKYNSYQIYPSISLASQYDDNILSNNGSSQSSLVWITSPQFFAISNWSRHQLGLGIQADIGRYNDFPSENYEDWEVSLEGTYELDSETRILNAGSVSRGHLERSNPNDANGLEPTKQLISRFSAEYQQTRGQFNFSLSTSVAHIDFDDVPAIRAGIPLTINQDDRDRSNYKTSLRVGYRPYIDQEYYIQTNREIRSYENQQDIINLDRTSTGYQVTAGFKTNFNGIYFGDIYAGYKWQDYRDTFTDIKTPILGIELYWNPTLLTTIGLSTKNSTKEALNPAFSGYISTETKLSISHELYQEILLKFSVNQVKDSYQSSGRDKREDSTTEFLLSANYRLDRQTHSSLEYYLGKRNSDDNTAAIDSKSEFQKSIIKLQIQKFF